MCPFITSLGPGFGVEIPLSCWGVNVGLYPFNWCIEEERLCAGEDDIAGKMLVTFGESPLGAMMEEGISRHARKDVMTHAASIVLPGGFGD